MLDWCHNEEEKERTNKITRLISGGLIQFSRRSTTMARGRKRISSRRKQRSFHIFRGGCNRQKIVLCDASLMKFRIRVWWGKKTLFAPSRARRHISYESAYCFFFSWLSLTPLSLYVTRLPSGISKLWGFRRGFTLPLPEKWTWTKRIHRRIFYLLDCDLLRSAPKIPPPLLHLSLRSIANAIQFRRREHEGGIYRPANGVSEFCLTQHGSEQKIEPGDTWEIIAIDFMYSYIGGKFLESFFHNTHEPVSSAADWSLKYNA